MSNTIWETNASESNSTNQTDVYLNVELQVAEDVVIRMPLNCPVSSDIKGMNANQRKLMELLLEKTEAALELPEGAERDEALTIQVPVKCTLFKRGSKEADTSGWTGKL